MFQNTINQGTDEETGEWENEDVVHEEGQRVYAVGWKVEYCKHVQQGEEEGRGKVEK